MYGGESVALSTIVESVEISDFVVIPMTCTSGELPLWVLGQFVVIQLTSLCQASSRFITECTLVAFGEHAKQ
jgi:hypothetical protein